ncbi:MAG: hypothetical protein SFT81_03565 [Candidatus Caenarcaniphilales bacterium]|nr:hypothetical protein [Candidatus Caenarcaniphilales bacterium]
MSIPALIPISQSLSTAYGAGSDQRYATRRSKVEQSALGVGALVGGAGILKTTAAVGGLGTVIGLAEGAYDEEVLETHKRNPLVELIKTWLPFINELANVLEHSLPFFSKRLKGRFYPDFDLKNPSTYSRMLIDTTALGAIAWSGSDESKHGSYATFMKSMGLTMFSFVLPTFFIPLFQDLLSNQVFKRLGMLMGGKWEGLSRLGSGVIAIALLEMGVKVWDHVFTPWVKDKFVPWQNKIFNGKKHSKPTEKPPSGYDQSSPAPD